MVQHVEGGTRSMPAAAATAQHLLVYPDSNGKAAIADATTNAIGTAWREAFAADELIPVRLITAEGTMICVANGVIAAGAEVNQAAGGKVSGTGTVAIGKAITAAGADGDWIEVARQV